MGLHGIAQFVNALDCGIGCSIKANAIVGAADVIVNGARNSYHCNAILGQCLRATEGTVTANGNNAV